MWRKGNNLEHKQRKRQKTGEQESENVWTAFFNPASSFSPCFRSEVSANEVNINTSSVQPDPPSKAMPVNGQYLMYDSIICRIKEKH